MRLFNFSRIEFSCRKISSNNLIHLLLIYLLFQPYIYGQNEDQKRKCSWLSAKHDNDILSVGELSDRYYSFGFQAEYMKQYQGDLTDSFINKSSKFFGISLNFQGYTPDYLLEEADPTKQRHFLTHTYFSLHQTSSNQKHYLKSQLNIGVSGNFVNAQRIQNWVHQNISGDRNVNGWSSQIEEKLTLHFYSNWKMELFSFNNHSIRVGSKQSIGNLFTYIQPNINYQFHFFKQKEYLPFNYHRNQKRNFSIEAEIGFQYKFLNASIEGEYFNKRSKIAEEDIIRSLLMAGVSFRYDFKKFGVFVGNYFNTRQIKTNQNHIWGLGGISISIH